MRSRSVLMGLSVVLIAGLLFGTAAATAAEQKGKGDTLKVGKKGEITLTQQTKFGDKVLQPDTYVVQHRVSKNGDHFVRLTELKQVEHWDAEGGPQTYTEENNAGEVKCRVERLPKVASRTVVTTAKEGDLVRVVRVEIKGENVAHVF